MVERIARSRPISRGARADSHGLFVSARLFEGDVLFFQRFLSCCGLYRDTLDGSYGRHTGEAETAFDQQCAAIAAAEGRFDNRSELNICGLRTDVQVLARRSLSALRAAGFDARIISGTRSYAEQNALYRQGRFGNPGGIVTRARGGQSWHNFGLAWDIGLFEGGQYLTDDAPYRRASVTAKITGLEWGGDWTAFPTFRITRKLPAGRRSRRRARRSKPGGGVERDDVGRRSTRRVRGWECNRDFEIFRTG